MRRISIPYDRVPGFKENALTLDYLSGKKELRPFLPPLLRGDREIKERVDRLGEMEFPREALAEKLLEYNREMGAGEATLAGVQALREGAAAVMAGQQPGLLGGPLYTILKALSACLLARHVEEKGLGRAVPVFWCASEDHDLAESNRVDLLDGPRPERLALDIEDRGASLSEYEIDRLAPAFIDRLRGAMKETEFTDALFERLPEWLRGGFGGWFSRQMLSLFGDQGLILLEPGRLRDLSAPFMEREIREPQATAEAIRDAGRDLAALGYKPSLTGDEGPGIFVIRDGVRERVRAEGGDLFLKDGSRLSPETLSADLRKEPGRFSSGVAIRPVVQDGIFPSLATIAGPSEISYLAQLGGVYRRHGIERPPILPRISLTLVEGKAERILDRLALPKERILDLGGRVEGLLEQVPTEPDGFPEARSKVEAALAGLREALPTEIRGTYPKIERRIQRELDRVQGKVEESKRRQLGLGEEQMRKLRDGIVPFGKLQERVWGILPFLNRYGPDLLTEMAGSVDLFLFEHQWLYLASPRVEAGAGRGSR